MSSTGNHMFIKFYTQDNFDYFKATIRSKESEGIFNRAYLPIIHIQ